MNLSSVYPYVVPDAYLETLERDDYARSLGHGVSVILALDHGGVCRMGLSKEMKEEGLEPEAAHALALENLERLARTDAIRKGVAEANGARFVIWHDHWLAATCVLLPNLHSFTSNHLGSEDLCVSIPHPGVMLVCDRSDRERIAVVCEHEAEAPNPITTELFSLTAEGISPA